MIHASTDILIMWCALIYFIMGIIVSFLIVNMICKNKKTNKRNYSFNKYVDEHSLEVFIVMILWPVYVFMALVLVIFIRFWKRFKR